MSNIKTLEELGYEKVREDDRRIVFRKTTHYEVSMFGTKEDLMSIIFLKSNFNAFLRHDLKDKKGNSTLDTFCVNIELCNAIIKKTEELKKEGK